MEDQKNPNQPIPFKKASAWKTFLGKKWAFPAIYIGSAAIILAIVMWYQGNATNQILEKSQLFNGVSQTTPQTTDHEALTDKNPEAVPVSGTTQPISWPVAKNVKYELGMSFFDDQESKEKQASALVKYDDSYIPHTGIDIKSTDGKSFDVTASLAGKVTKVDPDPLVGNIVEIEHANKMVTVYQSLEKVSVKVGDQVTADQKIGTAGRNVFEKSLGYHLHFEVRVDNNPVNPTQFLSQEPTQTR
ncbi:peptidoglycan DD-metalloendopeptidase family protein [Brevibacillus ginsengisoli]|uniref:peptidoglycan DD-metalloendopeptidase family protein n=1 Tax=Brevibacillus ginsengisoli TaxID=363854 RepID=UPI003CF4368F